MRGGEGEAGSQKPCNPEEASHLRNESRASLIARIVSERSGLGTQFMSPAARDSSLSFVPSCVVHTKHFPHNGG